MTAINSVASGFAAYNINGFSAIRAGKAPLENIIKEPAVDTVYTYDLAEQRAKLDQYLAERDASVKAKYGDSPPDRIGVAMPMDVHGRTPFVNADQQKLIDEITDKYSDLGTLDGLVEELEANGVHPEQIAANAQYFISPGGNFSDRRGRSVSSTVDILV
jgi:hypothetical protein